MKNVPAGTILWFSNSKAQYDSWYKGLSAVEKAMANSISKRGRAIEYDKFIRKLFRSNKRSRICSI